MSLNVNDQLHVLSDLLSEQSEECCGSISECQQIKRLVQSLMSKHAIQDEQLTQLLPEIYNYGRKGELAQNLDEHITSNQQNLQTWINTIDTLQ
ncbi:YtzH-like family protein [Aquibacillus sp. 3ASR75-11]|uniref:YtzH-like family protein n=1 Tax=Terrihalobacillus insolitus TaxID=2950438 RepID=A0A9X4ANR4_9BACI|nr:YtzH-like family protein [Terrihalobacillus insolitus]MDC3415087.1 YtzH-like family protein [Terrihalobacillus insolitus]MDC3426084.1 YtzH-like family protein [Terrihalobacillus insolitus]